MMKIMMRSNFFPPEKVGDFATGFAETCGLHEQGTLDGAGVTGPGATGFPVGFRPTDGRLLGF